MEEEPVEVVRNREDGPSEVRGSTWPKRAARRVGEDSMEDVDGGAIFGQTLRKVSGRPDRSRGEASPRARCGRMRWVKLSREWNRNAVEVR
jgi:hypothetical protein